MTEQQTCPECGLPLQPTAPAGLCPRCLLATGLLESPTNGIAGEKTLISPHVTSVVDAGADEGVAAGIQIGERVRYFGDYELLSEIARGGMGIVYKARQVRLDRTVALKMILAGRLAGAADVRRFQTEAEAAAQLDHPDIVPIFEVGEHEGHHFFSMGLVVGTSLMARLADGPLPPRDAAELVRRIAAAMQYAHDNDVIHRDLKPANILLDRDGNPRISDFGLAKRVADDSNLTASGQILGTPGFMAPEQAEGRIDQVGIPADVYSLGAILYASVTGRPPFQADNALDTLKQVLEEDPVAPRQLNSSIPRDLETICLKCIQKRPESRYASALELAEDLQRFLHDEPVRARRASSFERVRRWVRKRRVSIVVAGVAALVAVAAVIGAWSLWRRYDASRFGTVMLTTDEESAFSARMEDEQGRPVGELFTVPTESPISLREGSYRLRLSGVAQLSKTYDLDVTAGRQESWRVGLEDRRLWRPLEHAGDFRILYSSGGADVVPIPRGGVGPLTDGLNRFDGGSGQLMWSRALHQDDVPGFMPPRGQPDAGSEPMQMRWIDGQAPDLNGDGYGDLLLAPRRFPGLLAISGSDGSTLWWHQARLDVPEGDGPVRRGYALGQPLVAEVDGDEIPDVVMAVMLQQQEYLDGNEHRVQLPAETRIQAVSGETGEVLWETRVADELIQGDPLQSLNNVPWDGTWFSLTPARYEGRDTVIAHFRISVVSTEQLNLRTLDLHTGEHLGSDVELPIRMPLPDRFVVPRYIDPDGNGRLALVWTSMASDSLAVDRLSVVDAASGEQRWEAAVNLPTDFPKAADLSPAYDWPLAAALSVGSAGEDLLFPVAENLSQDPSGEKWLGLECYDGRTGTRKWRQRVFLNEAGFRRSNHINRIVPGPDIDGDGTREVFVACGVENRTRWEDDRSWDSTGRPRDEFVSVAAVSGADGHIVWLQDFEEAFSVTDDGGVGRMIWWQSDSQAGPLLVVPYAIQRTWYSQVYEGDATAWMLDPRDGSIRHTLRGVGDLAAVDFDGDGLQDLCGVRRGHFTAADPAEASPLNRLYGYRALPPQPVRRLGNWQTVGDVDSDGFSELVWEGRVLSGRTGELIWRIPTPAGCSEQGIPFEQVAAIPAPVSDLNGDGHADMLFWYSADVRRDDRSLTAVSGRDGSTLWSSGELDVQFIGGNGSLWSGLLSACRLVASEDLDADGEPELVFVDGSTDAAFRLVVISGRNGALKWQHPLVSVHDWDAALLINPLLVDLDGYGHCLITATVDSSGDTGIAALRGADGELLWLEPLKSGAMTGESWPALAAHRAPEGETIVAACFVEPTGEMGVTMFRAENGEVIGQTFEPLSAPHGGRPFTASPVFADVAGGQPCLCLGINHADNNGRPNGEFSYSRRVLGIDLHGQPLFSVELARSRWREWQAALRAVDLDGDGDRELVTTCENHLFSFDQSLEKPMWIWTGEGEVELLDVASAAGNQPATLIVRCEGKVFGLDGATGVPRWRCEGPGRVLGAICPGDGDEPARIAFADDSSVVLRDVLPTMPDGRYARERPGR